MTIVLMTGRELRHRYFATRMREAFDYGRVISFHEGENGNQAAVTQQSGGDMTWRLKHLGARQQAEMDLLYPLVFVSNHSMEPGESPLAHDIPRGTINNYAQEIIDLNPDWIVCYGCSIIKAPLLEAFPRRILNVHLGLSPYYRGSGTNYWPMVNGQLEYVGATFMWMDAGIDTGEVIHQIRPRVAWGDTPSMVGTRLIRDMVEVYIEIVGMADVLRREPQPQIAKTEELGYYRKKDYTEASVFQLYENWECNLDHYLFYRSSKDGKVPIVQHPRLT